MSDTDKNLRDLIIQKFMGNSRTVISRYEKIQTDENENLYNEDINKDNENVDELQDDQDNEDGDFAETYNYLSDDPLSKEFIINLDENEPVIVATCLYKINNDGNIPVLQFYFVKENAEYGFPTLEIDFELIKETFQNQKTGAIGPTPIEEEYKLEEVISEEMPNENPEFEDVEEPLIENMENPIKELPKEEKKLVQPGTEYQDGFDQEDIDKLFFEKISNILKSTTNLSPETTNDKYKGFIKIENKYVAVFDFTETGFEESEGSLWGIVDEIVNKKRILDIPVQEYIHNLFYENPFMKYINNSSGLAIEIPIIVYICEETNGSYDNSYYNVDETRENTTSLIDKRTNHEIFGSSYLFTSDPLNYNNLSKIKRFALFTSTSIYLLNDNVGFLPEYKLLRDYEMICFKENESEYWSVKKSALFFEL
jgi:hypothetical protein